MAADSLDSGQRKRAVEACANANEQPKQGGLQVAHRHVAPAEESCRRAVLTAVSMKDARNEPMEQGLDDNSALVYPVARVDYTSLHHWCTDTQGEADTT